MENTVDLILITVKPQICDHLGTKEKNCSHKGGAHISTVFSKCKRYTWDKIYHHIRGCLHLQPGCSQSSMSYSLSDLSLAITFATFL